MRAQQASRPSLFPMGKRGVPEIKVRQPRGPNPDGAILMATYAPAKPGHLPEEFWLVIRDQAMEPMLSVGEYGLFSTAVIPEPGNAVLLGTVFGPELRMFDRDNTPRARLVGCALNPLYEHIDSGAERVWIIATLIGIAGPVGPDDRQ